jgi:hypothetical protein
MLSDILVDMSLLSFFSKHMRKSELNLLLTNSRHFANEVLWLLDDENTEFAGDIVRNYRTRVLTDCNNKFCSYLGSHEAKIAYLLKRYASIIRRQSKIVRDGISGDDYFRLAPEKSKAYFTVLKESGIVPREVLDPVPKEYAKIFIGNRAVQLNLWNHKKYLKYYPAGEHYNDIVCAIARHLCWMETPFTKDGKLELPKITKDYINSLPMTIPRLMKYNIDDVFECPLDLLWELFEDDLEDLQKIIKLQKKMRFSCTCDKSHSLLELFFHDRKNKYDKPVRDEYSDNINNHLFELIVNDYPGEIFVDWICLMDDVTAFKQLNIPITQTIAKAYEHDAINILKYVLDLKISRIN